MNTTEDIIEISSDDDSRPQCKDDESVHIENDISLPNPTSYDDQWNDHFNYEWHDNDDPPPVDYNTPFLEDEKADVNMENDERDGSSICSDETIIYTPDNDIADSQELSQSTENSLDDQDAKVKGSRPKLSADEKKVMKEKAKSLKEEKRLERERLKMEKKTEQLKQKALKAAMVEKQRNIRPDESIKLMKVHIDNDVINSIFGTNILGTLQQAEVQYAVESQIKPSTIQWSKRVKESFMNDAGALEEHIQIKEENQLLYIVNWQKIIELVNSHDLLSHIQTVKSAYLNKNLTVVILGIEKYFSYQKVKKNREFKAGVSDAKRPKPKKCEIEFEEAPQVSRDELMFALTELQLIGKCNHRLLETPEELTALVLNFTKSIAQLDYKQQKHEKESDLEWFAKADSRQSVKVDKNGNGLLRLWQQQFCQFNMVGVEVAQAIVSHYNSPQALVAEYQKCTTVAEGELLLQNIPVRRNAGILSSSRKIGTELSKKIYHFFTSDNPDLVL